MALTLIRKRSGDVVTFEKHKIQTAISKAFLEVKPELADSVPVIIADKVVLQLQTVFNESSIPNVEQVQDLVEKQIAQEGFFEVAKSYILYRSEHAKLRIKEQEQTAKKAERQKLQMVKRDGSFVDFNLNEIANLLEKFAADWPGFELDTEGVLRDIKFGIFDNISAKEVIKVVLMALRSRIERDPTYSRIAARVLHYDLYKDVLGKDEFAKNFSSIYRQSFKQAIIDSIAAKQIDSRLADFDFAKLSKALQPGRDGLFEYLGAQTLYDRYYRRDYDQNILELPQYFWMRVAMGLALQEKNKEEKAIEFYEVMSSLLYVPSTPTLFHSGTPHSQMSSCYLTTIEDDLDHIFKCVGDNAQLAKWSGGIGNDATNIRGTGSLIKSTNVPSQGVIPFLKILDATTAAINRSGKRRGATCIYLECWHYDFEEFLELRKNTGDERRRTHEMNTASWIPDLFVKRVRNNDSWTLFSPDETPDLHSLYGKKFEERYKHYEQQVQQGNIKLYKQVQAVDLWRKMVAMIFETGHPWFTFKDACNIRSPQDHVGVVNSSNLCTEITLNTSRDETAVCNLGSIQLANHVLPSKTGFDWDKMQTTISTAIRMLDNVVDLNYYPTKEAKNSNLKHRPIGLGIMGFQDALYMMGMNFDSDEAVNLSDQLMEVVSYNAILSSSMLAKERGPYKSFKGSKWDRGILPLDTLDLHEQERLVPIPVGRNSRLDWDKLRKHIKSHGMRNSNTMAIAPTATIANISGCLPAIEPIYKNIYVKSNISGEFTVVNEYLVKELQQLNLWNKNLLDKLKYFDGNIQAIQEIPMDLRQKYKEAFQIEPEWTIKHAAYRGKWIDQSQSVNIFMNTQSGKKISETYIYAWEMGLKTTYYLRTLGASSIEKSTIDINQNFESPKVEVEIVNMDVDIVVAQDAQGDVEAKLCVVGDPDCEACQ